MKKYFQLLILFWIVSGHMTAYAASEIPQLCSENLNQQLPGWRFADVSSEVQSYAAFANFNPVVANGDFDGNGRIDDAILVEHNNKRMVGVCLQENGQVKLSIIREPYCDDLVRSTKSKTKIYNYDTEKHEVVENDSITVACFERAGATYVYKDGVFRMVVSSD